MKDYFNGGTAYYFETPPYCDILAAIGDGAENARHKSELIRLTGMQDRELRKTIEFLRRHGVVIISDSHGYYFPSNERELAAYVHQEEKRAKSVFGTLRYARQLLKKFQS